MARIHIAAILGAATFAVLVIFQLVTGFGLPQFRYLDSYHLDLTKASSSLQTPLNLENLDTGASENGSLYLLGVGKADITGPIVEINMMGYADPNQVGSGLRQRLYSRAFIIADVDKPDDRFVYLVLDTQSGDTAIRDGILRGLEELGPEYAVYGQRNVAVTGTHSHSGPGAWLNYLLPQITSKGFDKQSYRAIVDGALLSIVRAHNSVVLGHLSFGSVEVEDTNINRSPYAYLANPAEERNQYENSVDTTMTLLKFQRAGDGLNMGILTWFPVHGTSMLGNNTLISGDNKGVAADLFEKSVRSTEGVSDSFVAGFSQSNVGDTSPNVLGAYCEDGSGQPCNFEDSTCGGRNEPCHGRGPFFRKKDQGASSCYEIGRRQFLAAKSLYDSSTSIFTPISGATIKSLHAFHDLSNYSFPLPNGTTVSTCPAALGYSFAAGTTDGPGAFDFKQNNTGAPNANPLWTLVRNFLRAPTEVQLACHYPKPILLDVGEITSPYLWTPNVVDIQLLRVGQLLIIVSPGEATTMAGRRWKTAIASAAADTILSSPSSSPSSKTTPPLVVLGGPANSYTHYIATEQEYNIQRYEGASTLYGPHTLNAYINLTTSYLPFLASHTTSHPDPGPSPPVHINSSYSFITGVAYDRAPFFKSFGDVLIPAPPRIRRGETLSVTFVGANPRNDLRLEKTYAAVELLLPSSGEWKMVRDDSDWDLIFHWKRTSSVLGTSEVEIVWEIPGKGERLDSGSGVGEEVDVGLYRIRYFGAAKGLGGGITAFEGVSGAVEIF